MEIPFTVEQVILASGVNKLKVRNVYIFGSRVYGNNREDSDWDIILTAGHMLAHEEKRVNIGTHKLNIHIYTPDKFAFDLKNLRMANLECLMGPDWAKLQVKQTYKPEFTIKGLIQNVLAQSFDSWRSAKFKMSQHDIRRGQRGVFHSLRMLMFASQIAEHEKITDFSEANPLFPEICDSDEYTWDYYKQKYLPKKVELEEKLKKFDIPVKPTNTVEKNEQTST